MMPDRPDRFREYSRKYHAIVQFNFTENHPNRYRLNPKNLRKFKKHQEAPRYSKKLQESLRWRQMEMEKEKKKSTTQK